jgi:hypothetical protein
VHTAQIGSVISLSSTPPGARPPQRQCDLRLWGLLCGLYGERYRAKVFEYLDDPLLRLACFERKPVRSHELHAALSVLTKRRTHESSCAVVYKLLKNRFSTPLHNRLAQEIIMNTCLTCKQRLKASACHDRPPKMTLAGLENETEQGHKVSLWNFPHFDPALCYHCNLAQTGLITPYQAIREFGTALMAKVCKHTAPGFKLLEIRFTYYLSVHLRRSLWCHCRLASPAP